MFHSFSSSAVTVFVPMPDTTILFRSLAPATLLVDCSNRRHQPPFGNATSLRELFSNETLEWGHHNVALVSPLSSIPVPRRPVKFSVLPVPTSQMCEVVEEWSRFSSNQSATVSPILHPRQHLTDPMRTFKTTVTKHILKVLKLGQMNQDAQALDPGPARHLIHNVRMRQCAPRCVGRETAEIMTGSDAVLA
ncbi:hypothetical protein BDK51DRAFT_48635 [Blyttiomyces helicus]|uniref:Uncharacterized protein n=1 Tax=Blyttiomyces helicus TaxID=388810 RepID=A0A4P9WMP6_9FUNG|nr:hypothetical protein BDK51DRAFT_48635 [Blyttiomyces helicus]|eukprot:RKO92016.1 hypothetical protein BDK51DRAFT_48635 [Blyttiomyces helicus]